MNVGKNYIGSYFVTYRDVYDPYREIELLFVFLLFQNYISIDLSFNLGVNALIDCNIIYLWNNLLTILMYFVSFVILYIFIQLINKYNMIRDFTRLFRVLNFSLTKSMQKRGSPNFNILNIYWLECLRFIFDWN